MAGCYSGDNPVQTQEEGIAIWRWAKTNAIDKGMDFNQVHQAINQKFFGGVAKPQWINEILAGRKSPIRAEAQDFFAKQYNRRLVVKQAEDLTSVAKNRAVAAAGRELKPGLLERAAGVPRSALVAYHFATFPMTHAGGLSLTPSRWKIFVPGMLNAWKAGVFRAHAELLQDNMMRQPLYSVLRNAGLRIGPDAEPTGIFKNHIKGASKQVWDALQVLRFNLAEHEMNKRVSSPEFNTPEGRKNLAKEVADWANKATGTVTKSNLGEFNKFLFGPALTESKVQRFTFDPAKTLNTYRRMLAKDPTLTPGEKVAANLRMSGAVQTGVTIIGGLMINDAVNAALHTGQKVNYTDPTKSDFLSWKIAGMEGPIPGMHSELRLLAQILALPYMNNKQLRGESRQRKLADLFGQYGMSKTNPLIGATAETLLGQTYSGAPLPWSKEEGTAKHPKETWPQYFISHAPIILQGPAGYFYDQLTQHGMSSLDAVKLIKGLITFAGGAVGVHVKEDPDAAKREIAAKQLSHR